jgi:peptide/nickel transport system substrate-binding protein
VASRRILQGQNLVQGDGAPPAQVLKQALSSYKSQLAFSSAGGTRYIALNTTKKPFDNINVRKAVLAAFDRSALRLTRGGKIVGPIAWAYLPPSFPGHTESGGLKAPAQFDYLQSDTGDPALAASYMKKAGYPSGKYTGSEKLLTIATNADPGKKTAESAQSQFEKLGFKLNFRVVPQDTLYTKFCSVPKSGYVICPNVGFFKDYYDAQTLLEPTFSGKAINPSNNSNWPMLNDPKVNDLITKANAIAPGPDRDKAWAAVNLAVTALAPAIPFVWDQQPIVWSKNVQMVVDDYANSPFMAFLSIK